jgi:hypothetical protein
VEDSGINALIIGVYVFIFIFATSLTISLFVATYDYSNLIFEYNRKVVDQANLVQVPSNRYNIISGAELEVYKKNYSNNNSVNDKFEETQNRGYIFDNMPDTISINSKYILEYMSEVGNEKHINVRTATSQEEIELF